MRARSPDRTADVDVDGVRIAYEVHGDGRPTLLLLPAWMSFDSRLWKMQIPYLARHFRVITYDPPGNGKSDRPRDPAAYGVYAHLRYTSRVLDETETDSAVLAGLSQGGEFAISFPSVPSECSVVCWWDLRPRSSTRGQANEASSS